MRLRVTGRCVGEAALLTTEAGAHVALVFAADQDARATAARLADAVNYVEDAGPDLHDVLSVLLASRRLPPEMRGRLEGLRTGLEAALGAEALPEREGVLV
jgi:hypothetical protein